MLKIGIVSQKGGSFKTSTAISIAVAAQIDGVGAVIIDTDPQGTAEAWGDWRKGEPPVVISAKASNLTKVLDRAQEAGAELAIIDTPPLAQADAAAAARAADLVIVPCRPRAFDLHAIRMTADLIRTVGKTGFVLFGGGHPAATVSFYAEPDDIVKALGLEVCPIRISERADFHRAVMVGKAAQELEPDSRAAAEVHMLWRWICKQTGLTTQKQTRRGGTKAGRAAA